LWTGKFTAAMDVPAKIAGINAQLKAILEKSFFILDNLLKNAKDSIGFVSGKTVKTHKKTPRLFG
jgi:hypothetical protein